MRQRDRGEGKGVRYTCSKTASRIPNLAVAQCNADLAGVQLVKTVIGSKQGGEGGGGAQCSGRGCRRGSSGRCEQFYGVNHYCIDAACAFMIGVTHLRKSMKQSGAVD